MNSKKNTVISKKSQYDKFYTKIHVAQYCLNNLWEYCSNDCLFIEPSAGNGSFSNLLANTQCIAMDIMPESSQIVKQDFFDYNIVTDKKIVVIGNPPFGRASSLAIKFFNKAASLKSTEIIAFILPKTFRKISVQTKLNDYFELVKDIDLEKNAFTFNSLSYDVPSCFQIWKRTQKPRQNIDIQNIYIDFVKKDLSEFAIRRVGGRAGKILYGKDYNENSTYFCREKIDGIVKILEKIDFSKVVNSTAGQKSLAKKEIIIALHNYLSQSKDNYANI